MHRGYTKAWRKEIDSMVWKMPPIYHRIFFYLRQKVNWATKLFPTRYSLGIWVSPGMILTSCNQIAEGISYRENNREIVPDRKTIMRALEWMQTENMLQLTCHTNGTMIYLNNWDTYNVDNAELVPPIPNQFPTTKEYKRNIRIKKEKKRMTHLPENFEISERVKAWATKKGFTHLEEHLESFKNRALARGYQYVDWDSAFMEAVRSDWAKINNGFGLKVTEVLRCVYRGREHEPCYKTCSGCSQFTVPVRKSKLEGLNAELL
jgi:hypothetical protein